MLSQISQTDKSKYHVSSLYMWYVKEGNKTKDQKITQSHRYHRYERQMEGCQKGGGQRTGENSKGE